MNEHIKEKINTLKAEIDALRPLDKNTEGRIQQKFRLDWNYHSNNIEGNSLTFGETKTFLLHGITADGKPLKDHLDIKGHNTALEMLEDVVGDGRDLNETFIRELHQIILNEPYEKPAITADGKKTTRTINVGSYKTQPNHVKTATGETFYFAKPEETPAMMHDLMDWFNSSIKERKLHPTELAALLHYKFIRIHPFDDGNGRLARILMNLTLMKFGFPPVIIKTQKKDEYYRALQQADGGDTNFFVDYIAQLQIDSLELFLRGAKGERIEEEDDLDKEIALFKAELNKSNTNTIRTAEFQNKVLITILATLITLLENKTVKFNDLFHDFYYTYEDDVTTNDIFNPKTRFNSTQALIKFLNEKVISNLDYNWFNIAFHWDKFDKIGIEPFSLFNIISFKLTKYRYYLTYDKLLIEKTYNEAITESDVKDIVTKFTKDIFDEIKKLTEEKKFK